MTFTDKLSWSVMYPNHATKPNATLSFLMRNLIFDVLKERARTTLVGLVLEYGFTVLEPHKWLIRWIMIDFVGPPFCGSLF